MASLLHHYQYQYQYVIRGSTQGRQDHNSVSRNGSALSCSIVPPVNPASLRSVLSVFDDVDEISLFTAQERRVIYRRKVFSCKCLNLWNDLEDY